MVKLLEMICMNVRQARTGTKCDVSWGSDMDADVLLVPLANLIGGRLKETRD